MRINKVEIRNKIIAGAKLYDEYFLGKHYLVVYNSRCVKIQFNKNNFLHLTGVDTYLQAGKFFEFCIKEELTTNQFFFNRRYPYDFASKKVNNLINLPKLFNSDSIILEDVTTETKVFKIGMTELSFTLCFDTFMESSDFLTVCSHRVEKMSSSIVDKSSDAFFIDYVFSKKTSEQKYETIEYDGKKAISSDAIIELLSQSLVEEVLNHHKCNSD